MVYCAQEAAFGSINSGWAPPLGLGGPRPQHQKEQLPWFSDTPFLPQAYRLPPNQRRLFSCFVPLVGQAYVGAWLQRGYRTQSGICPELEDPVCNPHQQGGSRVPTGCDKQIHEVGPGGELTVGPLVVEGRHKCHPICGSRTCDERPGSNCPITGISFVTEDK